MCPAPGAAGKNDSNVEQLRTYTVESKIREGVQNSFGGKEAKLCNKRALLRHHNRLKCGWLIFIFCGSAVFEHIQTPAAAACCIHHL
jgi:hypothetical protein